MHKFAFVRLKTVAARDRLLARIPAELAFLVPFVPKYKTAFRLSESVLFFSAQSADFYRFGKGVARIGASLTAFDGYCRLDTSTDVAAQLARQLRRPDWDSLNDRISGEYAIGHYDHESDSFTCASDFTGMRPLYYLETEDLLAVSNRQMFLNPLCLPGTGTEIDLSACVSLLAKGNNFTDRSPLAGVRMVPPGHYLCSHDKGRVELRRAGRFIATARGRPGREDYRRATGDIVASLDWLDGVEGLKEKPITFSLTGGEDSRLMLALGLNSRLKNRMEAFTYGLPDHPDMLAAPIVARKAGVTHRTQAHKATTATAPIGEIWENLRLHAFRFEGAPGAWDGSGHPAQASRLDLTGLYAEFFKRVRDSNAAIDITTPEIGGEVLHEFQQPFDPLGLLRPGAQEQQDRFCQGWMERRVSEGAELNDLPELFYAEFRLPWWVGSIASNISGLERMTPLASKTACEVALKQSLEDRRDRRFIFEAMLALRPDLLTVPYLNKSWPARFRSLAPGLALPDKGFDYPAPGGGALPWQVIFAKRGGLDLLARFIADHGLDDIFSIIDRRRFEELVANPDQIRNTPSVRSLVNLAEILILMANRQLRKPDNLAEHHLTGESWDSNIPAVSALWSAPPASPAVRTVPVDLRRSLRFFLPRRPLHNLRIDPGDRPGQVTLHGIMRFAPGQGPEPLLLRGLAGNADLDIEPLAGGGWILRATGHDPQVFVTDPACRDGLLSAGEIAIEITAPKDTLVEVFYDYGAGFSREGMFSARV